ncbi:MAG TPA: Mur ligase family protein [Polyangiaceae bacterium LLY-WYZ-15_(1-7)]|nr:UDP-N-acetylmuramate:L-alanyl-gamma-D-glutamyl-meso-diaminopimelate ligase [Myxococcales bacterium]HJK92909.1 Mur ligase family protein [Polyangiaceae bacterium LLY-WYZ-15_(1-7)]HJL06580.1 Mur ligase family protein [Polyangiaceae bacterium LLY-WYZ-15_(1-7)]HJL13794.1 Mur ligase family protein [Polyangiaceae bacterium LLY-WYZ-15_(1-7)]HJL21059.1 Mur ligase family protein [Polyangiaceae bacterium LLY-WYZ-15_(1-7)]
MHVHLIGVCGTGMGALAGLLVAAGHRVTGSDRAFHPPMGPALAKWGVETMPGWDPANLEPAPDLVVVGNVCRPDNPEARAAIDGGLAVTSFPAAMEEMFLAERPGFVVAGTHGKTTTTSLLAFLLRETGKDPGMLVGGIPRNFDVAFRRGAADAPFVIEGDEYDSAFFEKRPKFWRYRPWGVVLTSVEHDHVDIYPDEASYLAAFEGLIDRIPEDGILVAWAGDARVRALARRARCRVRFYALEGDDCGDAAPIWMAATGKPIGGAQPLDLYGGGTFLGRVTSPLSGKHNARNALAAIALASEGAGAEVSDAMNAVARFAGVRRRQELLGVAGGVWVYEDFAHHPTAVRETLGGLKARHPGGRLVGVFEPRSATASRRTHQAAYPEAFGPADVAILAPVGRPEIPAEEKLDTAAIAEAIRARGGEAHASADLDEVLERVVAAARPGDAVVLMSNGAFGGIYDRVLAALTGEAIAAPARSPG